MYRVKNIFEADYGCEERPEGYAAMDKVILESEDGEEFYREVKDAELYDKDINVGDKVFLDENGQLIKCEG